MSATLVNPNSSVVSGVSTGGDISSAVIAYFGQKSNDAAEKTQEAIKKARSDSEINKLREKLENGLVQDGSKTQVSTSGQWVKFLDTLGDNEMAANLRQSMKDGTWDTNETADARALLDDAITGTGAATGRTVNDDAVNMALVQAAFQEFTTATNSMSAVVKKSGDTKDSIANRLA